MTIRTIRTLTLGLILSVGFSASAAETVELSAETLRDKIRGGLLGQMLGNLNGLPHEFKYIETPGNVASYDPALPEGARTDDDTDFEWVYILEMQQRRQPLLSPAQIAALWRERINRRIYCSNQYARQLMDLGIEPPLTGSVMLNPWAEFNISGQFLCETFGLIAPAMPQTAARIGLNYTRTAIEGEPAQTTQLFTTMISTAFIESDVQRILDAGTRALDPKSEVLRIVQNVRRWHAENPQDWRKTRRLIVDRYARHGGRSLRDRNGYELNTAATIAALVYGDGDFQQTVRTALNFGWDCDNTAATAGTIIGVVQGYRWMLSRGWPIVDRYRNTTRENMPEDETITSFADRLVDLAELVITRNGGKRSVGDEGPSFTVVAEPPGPVLHLDSSSERKVKLKSELQEQVRRDLTEGGSDIDRARATYLAICLGLASSLRNSEPAVWSQGVTALQEQQRVLQVLFHHSPVPAAEPMQRRFLEAGIEKPESRKPLW